MSNSIKAVIFDMDGVLIDARDWHYHALNDALELFGYSIPYAEHLRRFDGLPTRDKLNILSLESGLPRGLHKLINDFKQLRTRDIVVNSCRSNFKHELLLSRLKQDGYVLGLASNSIRASIDLMLTTANVIEYMDVIVSNEDVANGKPDPEIYELAARKCGFAPRECLVVEDSAIGAQSATTAGSHVLKIGCPDELDVRRVYAELSRLSE